MFGEPCDCPKTGKVWSTRWCYRRKGDTVRSQLVVRQFREGTDPSVHAGTPLLTLSAICSLSVATADFSVPFMHTPITEEVLVEPPVEANLPKETVWRLRRPLNGLRCAAATFQAYLQNPLEDVGFRRGMAAPSIYNREDDGVKMSVHVDDPLVIGPEGPIIIFFECIVVKGLETFDSVRGLKYLEMVYYTFPGGYLETTPSGDIEGMASMMGVTDAKTPTTPGIRPRQPTEAEENPVDETRQRVFRAIVGKAQWILRARPESRSSAEGCNDLVRSTVWQPRGW